jgi:hypothetical protein
MKIFEVFSAALHNYPEVSTEMMNSLFIKKGIQKYYGVVDNLE